MNGSMSIDDPASLGARVLLVGYTGKWFKDEINYAGSFVYSKGVICM
jgi:hypothetical protein